MRVAFIVNNYPPRTGGVELHVRSLAAELVQAGDEVTVVTLGTDTGWRRDPVADDRAVDVLTLPEHFRVADILGFPSFGTRRHLTKLLRERGIDVVSVHTRFFPMSFVGLLAARAASLPVIHTEHGSDHVTSDSAVVRVASRLVDFTLGRAVLRGADTVLGVSERVTAFVRRLAGVDATVFYNAIDSDAATQRDAVPDAVRDAAGSHLSDPSERADRPTHLVFVGRIVAGKGWPDYLESVAAMRQAGQEVTGEVLGDGAEMPKLRERIAELGLEDVVAVRGRVQQAEVREALRGATLVNPTTLSEGFQTTLLEAIAERGRVVTYEVPGAETLSAEGANVRITARRDAAALTSAVAELIAHPGDPAPPGFIDRWTWPTRAAEYRALCEAVIAAHLAASPPPPGAARPAS